MVSAFLLNLLIVSLSSLAEAKVVAHISLSAQRMNVSVNGVPLLLAGVNGQGRLSYADRHLQADRTVSLPYLDHL